MARRTSTNLSDNWRSKIQTSMLLNRLHGFVNGEYDMPPHAVTAALGLLRKTLPDLSHSEVVGEAGGPLKFVIERIDKDAPSSSNV